MSHFTVLVVGDNPEQSLAPYHEFECTGNDDEYVKDIDITDEARKRFEGSEYDSFEEFVSEWYGYETTDAEGIGLAAEHKYGYALEKDGEIISVIKRTNPNAKWDWYELGGRWPGFFKIKPGIKREHVSVARDGAILCDVCLKGDIDVDGMREDARKKAASEYLFLKNATHSIAPPEWTWAQLFDKHGRMMARKIYEEHPWIVAAKRVDEWALCLVTKYKVHVGGEKAYVDEAVANALTTHAIVMNGEWHELGRMGWFACVHDEKDDWASEFKRLFDSIPDTELVSLYDCHI